MTLDTSSVLAETTVTATATLQNYALVSSKADFIASVIDNSEGEYTIRKKPKAEDEIEASYLVTLGETSEFTLAFIDANIDKGVDPLALTVSVVEN